MGCTCVQLRLRKDSQLKTAVQHQHYTDQLHYVPTLHLMPNVQYIYAQAISKIRIAQIYS